MIKATWIKDENNPYITKVEDENGKGIDICSSKIESEFLSPRQLVQAALAGCLSMTIRRELISFEIEFYDVKVNVDMEEKENKTIFYFDIEIMSDYDSDKIEEIKQRAVNECYIRELLSDGVVIQEKKIYSNSGNDICDCCCG